MMLRSVLGASLTWTEAMQDGNARQREYRGGEVRSAPVSDLHMRVHGPPDLDPESESALVPSPPLRHQRWAHEREREQRPALVASFAKHEKPPKTLYIVAKTPLAHRHREITLRHTTPWPASAT